MAGRPSRRRPPVRRPGPARPGLAEAELVGRQRTAEQVALQLLAAGQAELFRLLGRFDALGRDGHAEPLGDVADGADDDAVVVARRQVLDEGAVDLDLVEGEAAQVAQRRIAGAEVVERHPYPHGADLAQDVERRVGVVDQHRFGHLHFEPPRRQARAGQRFQDRARERAVPELQRRHVDGHALPYFPARRFGAGPLDHPGADRPDEPLLLGERDEVGGRHQAAHRVPPADQRLAPRDGAPIGAHVGLEVQHELVAAQRAAQVLHEALALLQLAVHLGLEEPHRAAPLGLGAVERRVGALEQGVLRVAVRRREGHADADADRHAFAQHQEGLGQPRDDLPAQGLDGPEPGRPLDQHHELVAAEARHQRVRPDGRAQPLRHRDQQRVADGMAVAVVDGLEPVEVEGHHRGARALGAEQRAGQRGTERRAVRQVGQGVVVGEVLHPGLGEPRFGDVPGDAAVSREGAAPVDGGPPGQGPPARLDPGAERHHEVAEGATRGDVAPEFRERRGVAGRRGIGEQVVQRPARDGVRGTGQDLGEARRRVAEPGSRVGFPQPVARLLLEIPEEQADQVALALEIEPLPHPGGEEPGLLARVAQGEHAARREHGGEAQVPQAVPAGQDPADRQREGDAHEGDRGREHGGEDDAAAPEHAGQQAHHRGERQARGVGQDPRQGAVEEEGCERGIDDAPARRTPVEGMVGFPHRAVQQQHPVEGQHQQDRAPRHEPHADLPPQRKRHHHRTGGVGPEHGRAEAGDGGELEDADMLRIGIGGGVGTGIDRAHGLRHRRDRFGRQAKGGRAAGCLRARRRRRPRGRRSRSRAASGLPGQGPPTPAAEGRPRRRPKRKRRRRGPPATSATSNRTFERSHRGRGLHPGRKLHDVV